MSTASIQLPLRKATNVTIDTALLSEARLLHINISQAAESGLAQAVAKGAPHYGWKPIRLHWKAQIHISNRTVFRLTAIEVSDGAVQYFQECRRDRLFA